MIAIFCKQFDALEKNLKTNGRLFLTKTGQVTRGVIMDNEDNWTLAMVLIAVVGISAAILISVFYLNPAVEPAPTSQLPDEYSELPHGYRVSLYVFEGEHVESIKLSTNRGDWESNNIKAGETITLSTGENVSLLGFDSENNPLFNVK